MLDDAAWKMRPLPLTEWLTYNPAYGDTLAQKTDVWMAHDKNYLYLAFRCLDPEPRKIKTSIARRDTIWNDDWVGLSLDALGTGQSSYDLFSNPNGIQGDILNSSTAGEDTAPDWVWDSAGRITAEGYHVEMRIPLKSIRFKSGTEVRMGVLFWRRVSRLGMSASWPDLPRGKSIFTRYAPILIRDSQKAAHAGGDPQRHLLSPAKPHITLRLGRCGFKAGRRHNRQIRHYFLRDAGRDLSTRFQPG